MNSNSNKLAIALACTLLCSTAFAQQKGTFTDTRDGKTYKTVKIGEQVWLAENMNYNASGSKCYDNKPTNCDKYGRLYNWETAMKACPKGWHLQNKTEWEVLSETVGGEKTAGKYLKAINGWNEHNGKLGNGVDAYGFSILPGGIGNFNGGFDYAGIYGIWWSSSEYSGDYAYYEGINNIYENIHRHYGDKRRLYSVRCIKD